MLKGALSGRNVFSPACLGDQRSDRRRKTYTQRHGNKNKTVPQADSSKFGSPQLAYHQVICQLYKGMTQHPQDHRKGKRGIVFKFFGICFKHEASGFIKALWLRSSRHPFLQGSSPSGTARFLKINPENALERTNKKFIHRFKHLEAKAKETGQSLTEMSLEEMDVYWNEAKEL